MEISVKFTQEELMIISKALTLGIIHSIQNVDSNKMKEMEQKINMLAHITSTNIH